MKVISIIISVILTLVLVGFIVYNSVYIIKAIRDKKNNKEEK